MELFTFPLMCMEGYRNSIMFAKKFLESFDTGVVNMVFL